MRHGILVSMCIALAMVAIMVWAADAAVLAEFSSPGPDQIGMSGFVLENGQDVHIVSTGVGYRSGGTKVTLSNAWIIDADSREVVWEMAAARENWKKRSINEETYTAELAAGTYEVYYSTYAHKRQRKWSGDGLFTIFGNKRDRAIDKLLDKEHVDDVSDLYRKFSFSVEGRGTARDEAAVKASHEAIADAAIVSIRRLGDHEYVEQGFELKRTMKIHIYAIGESRKDGVFDYGWIINTDTGERVWRFTYDDSYPAGGAVKNRLVDSSFEAPAGKYVAVFDTDDSHSYDRWNSAPPFDPEFWGLTISAEDEGDARYASTYQYEGRKLENVVARIVEVGDDEYRSQGFTLKKDMDLRVYALGEGRDDEMYDYAWIVDADTRERVWQMEFHDTEHAGGGKKNRLFDGVIELPRGSYIVHYATDGSHSYPHWNTEPPMERKSWGVTVMGTRGYKKGDVAEYNEDADDNFLVRLTGVGDDDYRSETFSVDKDTHVHVYAIGEGQNGRMYDYGWIEDAETGRVVWEMKYRKTRHAGGAKKNRMFSDTILLKAGTYKVFYETDDSHSFRHWNAAKPYDPQNWGIALRPAKNG